MKCKVALSLQTGRRLSPETILAADFLRFVEADETKPAIGEVKIQLLQHKGTSATDS